MKNTYYVTYIKGKPIIQTKRFTTRRSNITLEDVFLWELFKDDKDGEKKFLEARTNHEKSNNSTS